MADDIRFHPFANGSQWGDWQSSNCERCTKYHPEADSPDGTCDLEWTLSLGGEECDGSVGEQLARRCGYLKDDGATDRRYVWPCTEVEWTEVWKEQLARKRGAL